MRNILKGFLNPKAEDYVFPQAETLVVEEFSPPEEFSEVFDAALANHDSDSIPGSEGSSSHERSSASRKSDADNGPIQYAQLQAELILRQAEEDAQQILAHAREQAMQECDAIRAGARDEGYRDGYAQGTAKALEDSIRDREATAARLEKDVQRFLEKASIAREEMLAQTQHELLDLCIAVAEKIVRVSLRSSSEVIVRMIQSATERMKRQEWVHIYISGCDTRGMAQISPALTAALSSLSQHIKVVPMGDDEGGTCIVETPEEIVDASVSTQLSNIRDVLSDNLKQF